MKVYKYSMILFTVTSLLFVGCNNKVGVKKQPKLETIKNYVAEVEVTYLNEHQENKMTMIHRVKAQDKYEIECMAPESVKGVKLCYDGNQTMQYFPGCKEGICVKTRASTKEILLQTFISRYTTCKNIKTKEIQMEGKNVTLIELPIDENINDLAVERLWYDSSTEQPIQMRIYSSEQEERIDIKYLSFHKKD